MSHQTEKCNFQQNSSVNTNFNLISMHALRPVRAHYVHMPYPERERESEREKLRGGGGGGGIWSYRFLFFGFFKFTDLFSGSRKSVNPFPERCFWTVPRFFVMKHPPTRCSRQTLKIRPLCLFVCLIWFFTSHQQSFSEGRVFLDWTSTKQG